MVAMLLSLAGTVVLPATATAVTATQLSVVAGNVAPYSFERNGRPSGFAVDIGRELLSRQGFGSQAINVVPVPRAITSVTTGRRTIMVGVERAPYREGQLSWIAPIFFEQARFFMMTPDEGSPEGEPRPLGTLAASSMEVYLREHNFGAISVASDPAVLARQLYHGRLAAVLAPDLVMSQSVLQAGLDPSRLSRGRAVLSVDLHIAASLDIKGDELLQWRTAFADMRADGTYDDIMARYLPHRG